MKKRIYAATVLLTMLPYGTTLAQEKGAMMDEVVVSATKTDEKVKDVSNALTLKNSVDIEENAVQSVGELLANEPGIDWRTRGNYGGASEEIHLRGMDGDATQVFYNGVNINSPSLGTADVGRLPLSSIEKVEVVKGSGSLLYGTGAMGGTVNIFTKKPERDTVTLKASAGAGSDSTYTTRAEHGMFITDSLGYYVTAGYEESDGQRDNSDLDHKDASLKLLYDKGDIFQAEVFGAYIDREFGVPGVQPPEGTQDYFVNGDKMYNDEAASLVNHGADEDIYSTLDLSTRPTDWLSLTLRGDYVEMEGYNYLRNNRAVWPKAAGEGQETWVTNEVLGAEATMEILCPHGLKFLVGSQYKDYDYENEVGDVDAFGNSVSGSKTSESHGVYTRGTYGEIHYRLNKYLKASAGLRHEHHSTFGYEHLPRFGLVLNPAEQMTVKINHGKHFKAPTMNDLYWPDNGWVRGNLDLQPETGWHSDITIDQYLLENKLHLSTSYFEWNIDDKIDWAENPAFPTVIPGFNYWTPSNINSAEAKGVEFSLTFQPIPALQLGLDYTYTDAEEEKARGFWRQALYTPDHTAKLQINYTFDTATIVAITIRYTGDRPAHYAANTDTRPANTLDSHTTADVKISQYIGENWLVALRGNNIFDKDYDTYMANFRDEALATTTRVGYPGAGRSILFQLTYEY